VQFLLPTCWSVLFSFFSLSLYSFFLSFFFKNNKKPLQWGVSPAVFLGKRKNQNNRV
jgi:hypothetical protein